MSCLHTENIVNLLYFYAISQHYDNTSCWWMYSFLEEANIGCNFEEECILHVDDTTHDLWTVVNAAEVGKPGTDNTLATGNITDIDNMKQYIVQAASWVFFFNRLWSLFIPFGH